MRVSFSQATNTTGGGYRDQQGVTAMPFTSPASVARRRRCSKKYGALIAEGLVHVLEDETGIAGIVVLIPEAHAMLLDNVAVKVAAQGRGYGHTLIAFAEATPRAADYATIRLFTNERMTENLARYPRLGYVETHRSEEDGLRRAHSARQDLSFLLSWPVRCHGRSRGRRPRWLSVWGLFMTGPIIDPTSVRVSGLMEYRQGLPGHSGLRPGSLLEIGPPAGCDDSISAHKVLEQVRLRPRGLHLARCRPGRQLRHVRSWRKLTPHRQPRPRCLFGHFRLALMAGHGPAGTAAACRRGLAGGGFGPRLRCRPPAVAFGDWVTTVAGVMRPIALPTMGLVGVR